MTVDGRDPLPRRDDGATFAAERVRSSGSPARVVAVLVAGAIGGLVGLSAIGPVSDGPAVPAIEPAIAAVAANATSLPRATAPRTLSAVPGWVRRRGADWVPMARSLLAVELRPAGSHLFVHGEIYALSIEAVEVRLVDPEGKVAASRRVLIPGGSTAFRLGAVPRFDVHFPVPDEMLADGLVVEAHALREGGEHLTVVRVPVTSQRGPM